MLTFGKSYNTRHVQKCISDISSHLERFELIRDRAEQSVATMRHYAEQAVATMRHYAEQAVVTIRHYAELA